MKSDDELIDGIIERFRPQEEPDDLAMFWWTEVKIMAKEILRLQRAAESYRAWVVRTDNGRRKELALINPSEPEYIPDLNSKKVIPKRHFDDNQ